MEKMHTSNNLNTYNNLANKDEIDNEIEELRQKYMVLKKDRLISQKQEKVLSNKMKLLSQEEIKVNKRKVTDNKNNNEKEMIRVNVLKNKEMVNAAKKRNEKNLMLMKKKVEDKKETTRNTMSNWRGQIIQKNLDKMIENKQRQNEIKKLILLNKEDELRKARMMHDKVRQEYDEREMKKKKEIEEKKIKIRNDLQLKIKYETVIKQDLDNKINGYHEKGLKIIQRINNLDQNSDSCTPYSSSNNVFKSGRPLSSSKKMYRNNSQPRVFSGYQI